MEHHHQRLGVWALGLSLGITWGIGTFLLGLASLWWMWGTALVTTLGSFYIGFDSTFWGSVVGGIWGFCDAFIGGIIIAWIYNGVACKKCCKSEEGEKNKPQ